ncbi:response regulator transcription factor [Pseudonocardia hispaniensis]|uniref:Response regulator transcription factor n=1 Tax=Pseudonocardia hispaniensis TaxID=904933 RepID=A0ABW1J906_9PSEU
MSRPLTPRELEVLHLVAVGYSNTRIGRRLHLTENTIKTYMRRILAALGARDRAHAVTQGFRHGLLRVARLDDADHLAAGVPVRALHPIDRDLRGSA